MAETKKCRSTSTLKKERDLYHNYLKVMARYGKKASFISKTQIAIEANNLPAIGGFYYNDTGHLLRIIRKMISMDREGRLPDFYPTQIKAVEGWGSDDPPGDWFECMECNNLYFKPRELPNKELMLTPNFCQYCGSFIKENEEEGY